MPQQEPQQAAVDRPSAHIEQGLTRVNVPVSANHHWSAKASTPLVWRSEWSQRIDRVKYLYKVAARPRCRELLNVDPEWQDIARGDYVKT
jgi:hypothetical protein